MKLEYSIPLKIGIFLNSIIGMKPVIIYGLFLSIALVVIYINLLNKIRNYLKKLFKNLEEIWLKDYIIFMPIVSFMQI